MFIVKNGKLNGTLLGPKNAEQLIHTLHDYKVTILSLKRILKCEQLLSTVCGIIILCFIRRTCSERNVGYSYYIIIISARILKHQKRC